MKALAAPAAAKTPDTPPVAVAAGAIAVATSPTVLLQLKNELRAEGQVTERLLSLGALNSIYASVLVPLTAGFLDAATRLRRFGIDYSEMRLPNGDLNPDFDIPLAGFNLANLIKIKINQRFCLVEQQSEF